MAAAHCFMLQAVDADLNSPVLETMFVIDNIAALREALALDEDDDPGLEDVYTLDDTEFARGADRGGVRSTR